MRSATLALLVLAFAIPAATSFALSPADSKIVRGKYLARGNAQVGGLVVRYQESKASVFGSGRVRGTMERVVTTKKGKVIDRRRVKIKGVCTSLREKGGKFTAPARIRLSDGTVIRGSFNGLTAPDQRLSRYFRGKVSGASNSRFVLRSR